MLDLEARVDLEEVEAPAGSRAGTRPCRRSGSRPRPGAGRPPRPSRPGGPRPRRATGTPRRASGGAAGSSTRARRGAGPGRGHRRAPGSRRGGARRSPSRGRRCRRRTRRPPRSAPAAAPTRALPGVDTSPHALPAAAPGRLDHHREAEVPRGPMGVRIRAHRVRGPGHDRHARLDGRAARRRLVAHPGDRRGRRAHEHEARGAARLGEGRVLGQEAVARDGRPRPRSGGRPRPGDRSRGSSRPPAPARSGGPRRPAGRGGRPDPPRSRRPPCGCRRPGTRGSRAPRSRPGWRSGASRTWPYGSPPPRGAGASLDGARPSPPGIARRSRGAPDRAPDRVPGRPAEHRSAPRCGTPSPIPPSSRCGPSHHGPARADDEACGGSRTSARPDPRRRGSARESP